MKHAIICLSDLHVGNLFDFKAYYDVLSDAERYCRIHQPDSVTLVYLGDVCDSAEIYRTQVTLAEKREQRYIAAYIINEASVLLDAREVIVTAGNHDLRKHLELSRDVVDILRNEYKINAVYTENFITRDYNGRRFLFTHTLSRRSRGSYYGGLTGLILTSIMYVMVKTKSDIAVVGHTHRGGAWQDIIYQCSSFHIESMNIMDRTMWMFIVEDNGAVIPLRLYAKMRPYSTYYQREILQFYVDILLKLDKVDETRVEPL